MGFSHFPPSIFFCCAVLEDGSVKADSMGKDVARGFPHATGVPFFVQIEAPLL